MSDSERVDVVEGNEGERRIERVEMDEEGECRIERVEMDEEGELRNERVDGVDAEGLGVWLFYPSVEESKKPSVNLSFKSLEEGENFYKAYAKLVGFNSRKSTTKLRSNTRERYSRDCVCMKQGAPIDSKHKATFNGEHGEHIEKKQRTRLTIRCGCPAMVRFQKDEETLDWNVVRFIEEHNHLTCTPSKVHFLRNNRQVTDSQKCLLNTFNDASISITQAVNLLGLQSGGIEHIGCMEKDIRNHQTALRKETKDFDAQLLVEYFSEIKDINPSFYYAIELDEEDKLKHYFWVDGSARKAYAHFGDVIVFDTTYDTNQYHMIFAPFTGINNHRQSVGFGWGLIKDEKIESFVWLFEKFMDAMSERAPGLIITDQDPAMKNAIAQMFPATLHRLCMWHILRKLPDKIRRTGDDKTFYSRISTCVYMSETPEQFEHEWSQITCHYKLDNDKWLSEIFSIRERWIPAYSKNVFSAGVNTTQRSESLNAFFERYVTKKNTLMEFISRFTRAIKRQRHNELKANFDNQNGGPKMLVNVAIEKQMADIYTHAAFAKFQDQLVKCAQYASCFQSNDGDLCTYVVEKFEESTSSSSRIVVLDKSTKSITCDCKMFEIEGIPCRHILITYRNALIRELPDQMIMKRWTKTATEGIVHDRDGVELRADARDPEKHTRIDEVSAKLSPFMTEACSSKESFELLMEVVDEMMSSFHLKREERGIVLCRNNNIGLSTRIPSQIHVHPPELSKTKGSGKRIKGSREKAVEKAKRPKRHCKGCNKPAHHDKRNCPNLKGMATMSTSGLVDEDDTDFDDDLSITEEEEINLTGPYPPNNLSHH